MQPTFKLTPKGLAWLRKGHLWIYRDDVGSGPAGVENGEVARIESSTGTFVGQGFYSTRSKIALRIITYDETPVDRDFCAAMIGRAQSARGEAARGGSARESAYRLVSAEGDLFPGLILDVYAGHVVIQSMIAGVDRLAPVIVEILEQEMSPATITLRNDVSARALEGLDQKKEMIKGEPPRAIEVVEGPVKFLVDAWEGHKTGSYLDQAVNRRRVARWCPESGRALDAFCYQGHFSLHLAARGLDVTAIDGSAPALERLGENAALNDFSNIEARKGNVFEELPALERSGERFDAIVLDPPPFAKGRKDVAAARKGYRELNRRAMALLAPGGVLFTYSCSSNFTPRDFEDMLREAGADARRQLRIIERHTQAPDHPVLLSMPETSYLKGLVLKAFD